MTRGDKKNEVKRRRKYKMSNINKDGQNVFYRWKTEEALQDNYVTMCDFLDNHADDVFGEFTIELEDGSYCEIMTEKGKYELHASGDGDFCNHKVEIIELKGE